MIEGAKVALRDNKAPESTPSVLEFELDFEASLDTGIIFCELVNRNGDWTFSANQKGFPGGLAGFLHTYGIETN